MAGRSISPHISGREREDEPGSRIVIVRFTGSTEIEGDLRVRVGPKESVREVVEKIRSARPNLSSPTTTALRLIHAGRLLTPGIRLLPWLESLHARHAHQAALGMQAGLSLGLGLGEVGKGKGREMERSKMIRQGVGGIIRGAEDGLSRIGLLEVREREAMEDGDDGECERLESGRYSKTAKGKGKQVDHRASDQDTKRTHPEAQVQAPEEEIWLHCVVSTPDPNNPTTPPSGVRSGSSGADPNDSATTDAHDQAGTRDQRRGFNALLEAGLNPAEVEQVRRQFYQGRGEEMPSGFEADDEHVRAMEEQWIEGDLTNETAQITDEGIYTTTLQGVLVGFLFPLMAWTFFKEIPAPNFFEPFEVEPGRRIGGTTLEDASEPGSGREMIEPLDSEAPSTPMMTQTRFESARAAGTGTTRSTIATSRYERIPRAFTLRGQPGGEWVVGVTFGTRVQFAILLGTILNLAFGALRFLA